MQVRVASGVDRQMSWVMAMGFPRPDWIVQMLTGNLVNSSESEIFVLLLNSSMRRCKCSKGQFKPDFHCDIFFVLIYKPYYVFIK